MIEETGFLIMAQDKDKQVRNNNSPKSTPRKRSSERHDKGHEQISDGTMPPSRTGKQPRFEHATSHKKDAHASEAKRQPKDGGKHADEFREIRKRQITNPRELVVDTLIRIENGGFSNIVWDLAVKHANLNSLDKMLATRIFYGTLSNIRLIDALWSYIEPEMVKRADPVVKMTLRSAMYQLIFLDRVPAYSIVSTSVDVVKRLRNRAASGYCNALLRKAVARQESEEGLKYRPTGDRLTDFGVQYSLNDELSSRLIAEFGDEADEIAKSMLSVPRMVLRVNQSKTSMADFLSPSVECLKLLPDIACAIVSRNDKIDEALERGDVCVQDEAAQLSVLALGMPASWKGDRDEIHIWDTCAGLGGKSIHILDEIACDTTSGNTYKVLSTDLYANKLERLKDYQQRHFPTQTLITKARDLTVGGSVPLAPFDVILVDAPCSGLGVLRRHPEVKLSRTEKDISALVELQKQILNNVCRHLRVGGILVYAVCTITQDECEKQVETFLGDHPNFKADALPAICCPEGVSLTQRKLLPNRDECDGFFIARFVRVG